MVPGRFLSFFELILSWLLLVLESELLAFLVRLLLLLELRSIDIELSVPYLPTRLLSSFPFRLFEDLLLSSLFDLLEPPEL